MAWTESHTVLIRHRKTVNMALQLKIKPVQVVGHLTVLWHSILEQAEDGDISKWSPGFIASAACWEGSPDDFMTALVDNGWLDNGIVHDWLDYAGRYLESKYRISKPGLMAEIRAKHGKSKAVNKDKTDHRQSKNSPPNLNNLPNRDNQTLPKEPKAAGAVFALPDWIDPVLWAGYLEIRKAKRAASTVHALNLTIATLAKLREQGNDPKMVLEQSIQRGWQGVFAISEDFKKKTGAGAAAPIPGKYDGIGTKV